VTAPQVLVVAKAPIAGKVKTRLGATIGMELAAELAAAALLDTLEACTAAVGVGSCHLSLEGDLAEAVHGEELLQATTGWHVHPQVGDDFAERLAHAHEQVAAVTGGPVVQVGMDTPHLTATQLLDAALGLADHDAVLGPAADGGWWVLALRDPARAAALRGVPMSTEHTGRDTRAALEAAGLSVGTTVELVDVDTVEEADLSAEAAPHTRFARAWTSAVPTS
jgi:rSAM/selenodomain-associated transferase 1